jgi:hypothetical protein
LFAVLRRDGGLRTLVAARFGLGAAVIGAAFLLAAEEFAA